MRQLKPNAEFFNSSRHELVLNSAHVNCDVKNQALEAGQKEIFFRRTIKTKIFRISLKPHTLWCVNT